MAHLKNFFLFKTFNILKKNAVFSLNNNIKYDNLEKNVREYLNKKSAFLKFSGQLEDIFQSEDRPVRLARYFVFGLLSIILYDLICISDLLTIHDPDLLKKIIILRLLITTPVIIGILFLILVPVIRKYLNYIPGIIVGIMILQTLYILKICNYADIAFYNLAWFSLIPVVLNVVMRIEFFTAFIYSIISFSAYLLIFFLIYNWPMNMIVNTAMLAFLITIVSVISNYYISKDQRREFLLKIMLHINSLSLEKANIELKQRSNLDAFTGLKNRGFFDLCVEQEWMYAMKEKKPISLIFIDIDFFKKFNDNYGHQAGDSCIRQIAEAIMKYSRQSLDLCARYGGEEFVVLLPNIMPENAVKLAERIKQSVFDLKIKHEYSGIASYVTISLGVAGTIPKEKDHNMLIEAADKALYRAKADGRNRVVIHEI